MSKYEVLVTVRSEENKSQIKIVAGTFDMFMNAKFLQSLYRAFQVVGGNR